MTARDRKDRPDGYPAPAVPAGVNPFDWIIAEAARQRARMNAQREIEAAKVSAVDRGLVRRP
jgi:hypothetical protein